MRARRMAATWPKRPPGAASEGLAETFNLPHPPRRIEVYDNSHIMGTNAVGGMIVAGPEGFVKNQYRKFNIKSTDITPGDDFGMMREVMQRRFSRLLKDHGDEGPVKPAADEDPDAAPQSGMPAWPDLVLIDGGKGQMSAVRTILEELGIADKITAIGVAKGMDREAGRERFFVEGKPDFTLPPRDPVLYFIQRLRDEAHRFAIGSHRARRKKDMVARIRSTRLPGSGRRASGRCCTISAPPRRSRARESTTSSPSRGFHEPWPNWSTIISTRKTAESVSGETSNCGIQALIVAKAVDLSAPPRASCAKS
jgi:excinuclease UvrABC nuclease subunit